MFRRRNNGKPRIDEGLLEAVRRYAKMCARSGETDALPVIVEHYGPRPDVFDPVARPDHRNIAVRMQPDAAARDHAEDIARDVKKLRALALPFLFLILLVLLIVEPSINFQVFQRLGIPPGSRWTYVIVLSVAFVALVHYVRETTSTWLRRLAVAAYGVLGLAVGAARTASLFETPTSGGRQFAFVADMVLLACTVIIVPILTSNLFTRVQNGYVLWRSIRERQAYIDDVAAKASGAGRERNEIERAIHEWDRIREYLQAVFDVARQQALAEINQFRTDD